ncbi:hypothetical protein POM88_027497 [Heracleum sosnowskyi]|uniref:Uncharacterized protein n=1 Tax=Heracleum sosnowskyi TaxID=360622 RepID=A0AAD8I8K6_9APIA|nr:hypothetical protein POM88_027497 [Heracleum sosnowskyi]
MIRPKDKFLKRSFCFGNVLALLQKAVKGATSLFHMSAIAMGVMFQSPPVFFALLICFLFGSAYSVEDIPDVDGDRDFGIQSLSVSFGQKRVSNFYNNNRKAFCSLPMPLPWVYLLTRLTERNMYQLLNNA